MIYLYCCTHGLRGIRSVGPLHFDSFAFRGRTGTKLNNRRSPGRERYPLGRSGGFWKIRKIDNYVYHVSAVHRFKRNAVARGRPGWAAAQRPVPKRYVWNHCTMFVLFVKRVYCQESRKTVGITVTRIVVCTT